MLKHRISWLTANSTSPNECCVCNFCNHIHKINILLGDKKSVDASLNKLLAPFLTNHVYFTFYSPLTVILPSSNRFQWLDLCYIISHSEHHACIHSHQLHYYCMLMHSTLACNNSGETIIGVQELIQIRLQRLQWGVKQWRVDHCDVFYNRYAGKPKEK